MCQAVDDICHCDVGMEPSMVSHLWFIQICTVSNGIDVLIAFHLEVLVDFQSTITCHFVPCFAKQQIFRRSFALLVARDPKMLMMLSNMSLTQSKEL